MTLALPFRRAPKLDPLSLAKAARRRRDDAFRALKAHVATIVCSSCGEGAIARVPGAYLVRHDVQHPGPGRHKRNRMKVAGPYRHARIEVCAMVARNRRQRWDQRLRRSLGMAA